MKFYVDELNRIKVISDESYLFDSIGELSEIDSKGVHLFAIVNNGLILETAETYEEAKAVYDSYEDATDIEIVE